MAILYFSDVLRKVGLDPAKVKLLRHAFSHQRFKDCYEKNMVLEYTRQQDVGFSKGYDYWCVFVSGKGTLAKLHACYKVGDAVPNTLDIMPVGFPHPEAFDGKGAYYDLEHIDLLKDYEDRLIIDWGKGTHMFHHKGTTEKPIIALYEKIPEVFPGFENLILKYDDLREIIEDNVGRYETWHTALSAVNAIYLIVDKKSGTQYVGSAYNENGLLGRWTTYVSTGGHGNNKLMVQAMKEDPNRCHDLQFSVLQILPKTMTSDEVINTETLWKEKLLTKPFGWNAN